MALSAVGASLLTSPLYPTPVSDGSSSDLSLTSSTNPTKPKSQFRSDFATLISDVKSGDMTSAKQALAAVQSDISTANAAYSPQSTTGGTQLPPDLQNLFNAVQSGDATGAQNALTQLQSDSQQQASGAQGHHHHHHHHAADANDASSPSTSSSTATLGPTSSIENADGTTPPTA